MQQHILIVEDDPIMRLGMSHFLSSQGYLVTQCADGREGLDALGGGRFDLVVTDLRLPHADGFEVLRKTKDLSPKTGVIIITGHAEIKGAVQAIREGASDYLAKPFSNEELLLAVERFSKVRRLEDEVHLLRETLRERKGLANLIGVSPTMMNVFDRITSVAGTDVPVLILGESGTGKELVANAVHGMSGRSDKPLVKINCAAIPESLFESELFGHEKGTFTGAAETRKGKFEFADGGSIFFDEIGDMPLSMQAKLLRVLEDQTITRLGGNASLKVNVRSIYATSRNLKDCVAGGSFRGDLFYRINVAPIVLPPLRDRKEDIPYFLEHFIRVFSQQFNKTGVTVTPRAYDALLSYGYPGNVRELKHAIERAVIFSKNGVVDVADLPEDVGRDAAVAPCVSEGLSLQESLQCFERERIRSALRETGGKKSEAALKLGISRKVLWKRLKELGIE